MGQMWAVEDSSGLKSAASNFPGILQRHAYEVKQAATITYPVFVKSIQELNEIASGFRDMNGKSLVFQVKSGSDKTFLWRGTVRIKCHKVDTATGGIETSRQMNLKQYVRLYNEIKRQASITDLSALSCNRDFSASIIINGLDGTVLSGGGTDEVETDECCICMDRKSEVILTCSHAYCENCIDKWQVRHQTCPQCRASVRGASDTWVLTDRPDPGQIAMETTRYLMELSEQTGVRAPSSARHGGENASALHVEHRLAAAEGACSDTLYASNLNVGPVNNYSRTGSDNEVTGESVSNDSSSESERSEVDNSTDRQNEQPGNSNTSNLQSSDIPNNSLLSSDERNTHFTTSRERENMALPLRLPRSQSWEHLSTSELETPIE